jgi:predicted nucleic acid-binding protein
MVSRPFVVDSNVFISLYYEGDVRHADAVAIFKELADNILVVHPYVIQETATVLTYKLGLLVANSFLGDISNIFHITIPPVDTIRDIETFKSLRKKISFTDAVLIDLAKRMDAHLVTFDKDMLSLYRN